MNEELYIGMAEEQLKDGNTQAALTILTGAIKSNPDSAALRLARGKVYLALGNQEAALFDAKKAAELKPEIIQAVSL